MNTLRAATISGLVLLLALTGLLATRASSTEWSIEGIMSDACQCAVTCPCQFLDKPTLGHCADTFVLSVDKGHYGKVSLDGQSIVIVTASKEGQRVVDTVGDLVFANIYVSDKSSQEQRDALVALTKALLGADKGD